MLNKVFLKPRSVKRINFVNMPKVINYEFPHIPGKRGVTGQYFLGNERQGQNSTVIPAAAILYRFLNKLYDDSQLHDLCYACILNRRGTHLHRCSV